MQELAEIAWQQRAGGIPQEYDLDEVLRDFKPNPKGPVLLVEPADNIGGGAPGDCTDVMRALLKHDVSGAGVVIADAKAVRALERVPVGGHATIAIGGRGSRLDLGPVTLEVELVSRSDGRFELEDLKSQIVVLGRKIDMGQTRGGAPSRPDHSSDQQKACAHGPWAVAQPGDRSGETQRHRGQGRGRPSPRL